ncbi:unnamed protein product [Pelagomonas calceolata]|uniref:Acyltransferase n=1 Tax=Pelagomonas calceolata TaxID=35677 RepID=A0A7S3ZS57_9STRA|nr:unnamed protein product [Pelagomonas calceolata]
MVPALTQPTRSYIDGTPTQRRLGFVAASIFSATYVIAPVYLLITGVTLVRAKRPLSRDVWLLTLPLIASALIPAKILPKFGRWLLQTKFMACVPYYFEYEEYHEITDQEVLKLHEEGKRVIGCMHPHGVFPFVSVCAVTSTLQAKDGFGDGILDLPTAVANVIRTMPILKDVVGVFGCIDASGSYLKSRLQRRKGSVVLYVGGMVELFYASPKKETVFLKQRKGFVKLALRTGADLVPVYLFGNTTSLEALKWPILAKISRKTGVSFTLFWGRWFLPLPKKVKLTYARGRPLGLPHIENPTDADVEKYHALYVQKLVELFDRYKKFNPDYADKQLAVE